MPNDTIRLLRQCDAGAKMAIKSIKDTKEKVSDEKMRNLLEKSQLTHVRLSDEITVMLLGLGDDGKQPSPIAQGMSWIKTNIKLGLDNSDKTVAELITDGCDMGIKSLSSFVNEYENADKKAKTIAEKLINAEQELLDGVRDFL